MTCVLNLPGSEIEGEDGDGVRVLVGDDEELPAVVELEVTRGFPPCVEEANLGERPAHGPSLIATAAAALLDAEYRDRFMSAIGDDDEPSGLMDANTTAGVHRDRERRWHRLYGLDQPEGGAAAERVHRQTEFLRARNLAE